MKNLTFFIKFFFFYAITLLIVTFSLAQNCSGYWVLQRPLTVECVSGQWVGWQNNNNPTGCPINPQYVGTQSNTFTFISPVSEFTIDFFGFDGPPSCARIELKINDILYPLTISNLTDFPSGSTCLNGAFNSVEVTSDGYITKSDLNPVGVQGRGRISIDNVLATTVTLSTNDAFGTVFSSPFNCTDVVPLQLLSFSATGASNCTAKLNWKTGIELNVKNIEVQRSYNGSSFQTVAEILSKGNNSSYFFETFQDADAFFRLLINDIDGRHSFSEIINVKADCKKSIYTISPNPTNGVVQISGVTKNDDISIFDMLGRHVLTFHIQSENQQLNIQDLSPGVYTLKIFNNGDLRGQIKILKTNR